MFLFVFAVSYSS